jgi:hypothetical protein
MTLGTNNGKLGRKLIAPSSQFPADLRKRRVLQRHGTKLAAKIINTDRPALLCRHVNDPNRLEGWAWFDKQSAVKREASASLDCKPNLNVRAEKQLEWFLL